MTNLPNKPSTSEQFDEIRRKAPKLFDERIRPLFDVHVKSLELRERMMLALTDGRSPDVNTREYEDLLAGVGALSNVTARLIAEAMRMRMIGQHMAYEAFLDAVKQWTEDSNG